MNTFSITPFRQKMLNGAMMIIILLQTACATQVSMTDLETSDWNAPNRSKPVAKGSDAALIYSFDMPGEVSAWPEVQPIAQGDTNKGTRIVLLLHNQQEIVGRLLSVRDHALVISTNEAQGNRIDAETAGILVVKNQDIQRVIIKGKSRVLKGMGLGLLIGVGTGAIIGLADGDDSPGWFSMTAEQKAAVGGIALGGAGLIVGTIAGAVTSKADKAIDPLMNHDFSALKPLAQFPEKEPEYLSAIK